MDIFQCSTLTQRIFPFYDCLLNLHCKFYCVAVRGKLAGWRPLTFSFSKEVKIKKKKSSVA